MHLGSAVSRIPVIPMLGISEATLKGHREDCQLPGPVAGILPNRGLSRGSKRRKANTAAELCG